MYNRHRSSLHQLITETNISDSVHNETYEMTKLSSTIKWQIFYSSCKPQDLECPVQLSSTNYAGSGSSKTFVFSGASDLSGALVGTSGSSITSSMSSAGASV